jgi:hypothetical protein
MEGVSDEVSEIRGRRVGGGCLRLVGAVEEVVDETTTHLCDLFMTVEVVLKKRG